MHRRVMLVGVVVLVALAFPVGSAGADPANNPANRNGLLVELNCPAGTFTGVTIAQNNAVPFQIVGETQVAVPRRSRSSTSPTRPAPSWWCWTTLASATVARTSWSPAPT